MRGASLSNPQVIGLLNGSYVPVFLSNEDFTETGSASKAEKAELRRIQLEGYAKRLSVGSVHAFILSPAGTLVDSMHTAEAAKPERLIAMLERNSRSLGIKPGEPIVKPAPPAPPACAIEDLSLYLTARYLDKRGEDDYAVVKDAGGNWSAFPSEDWIILPKEKWIKAIPARGIVVGSSWEIDPALRDELFLHFYPPTENWDLGANKIESANLKATVESSSGGSAVVRLEGSLLMKHPFYHKDDDRYIEATVVGYMTIDPAKRAIRSFNLVTDRGNYKSQSGGGLPFGVAVRM